MLNHLTQSHIFSFLLNVLGWYWGTESYRFQVHSSRTHHPLTVPGVHRPESSLLPPAFITPYPFHLPPAMSLSSITLLYVSTKVFLYCHAQSVCIKLLTVQSTVSTSPRVILIQQIWREHPNSTVNKYPNSFLHVDLLISGLETLPYTLQAFSNSFLNNKGVQAMTLMVSHRMVLASLCLVNSAAMDDIRRKW